MRWADWRVQLLLVTAFTLLSAHPSFAQADRSDPWETMNRGFFAVEQAFDRVLVGPLALGFSHTPAPLRVALRNVTSNLREPLVAVNDLLQGHVGTAASTIGRFAINSTFGLLGVVDVAKRGRIPRHDNGFGTTLGRWGVRPGPYLFLPFVGPTTLRDAFGDLTDIGIDPLTYVHYSGQTEVGVTTTLVDGVIDRIDASRDLSAILETSTDPYATIRSYYLQNRQYEITGRPAELEPLPDFDTPGASPQPENPPENPSQSPPQSPPQGPPQSQGPTAQPSPGGPPLAAPPGRPEGADSAATPRCLVP